MNQRLKPIFEEDQKGKNSQWTFESIIERLKSIRKEQIYVEEINCYVISEPEKDQQRILALLDVKL